LDDGKTGENLWVFELVGFSGGYRENYLNILHIKIFKLAGIVAEFNGKSPHNFPTYSTLQNRENCSFFKTSKPINY
jgi:hypothetical protein